MATLAEPPAMNDFTQPHVGFRNSLDPAESDFSYRPIPMSAIVGSILSLLSIAALMVWLAIPLALVAALVCLIATVQILRSSGEFAGLWLAGGGLGLSLLMAVGGILLTAHRYRTEIPQGYQRVSFARDIAARGVGYQEQDGQMMLMVPNEVKELEGQRVYLKGFMYPQGRAYDITNFVLCKDNAQCCFGGQPALQDMIGVRMNGKLTATYTTSLMGVAGTLKLNADYQGGNLEPIYLLEADYVAPALTSL